jgi:phosphohistidine phosphatase
MEIYMMQHGEALPKEEDPQKGLSKEGERQIGLSAKAISRLGIVFDLIISSPKKRARQTAEIVAKELNYPIDKMEVSSHFEPLSPPADAISYLNSFMDKGRIFIAGHLPSLAEIASELMSEGHIFIQFQMGCVCCVDVEELPTHKGRLIWHLTPEQLTLIATTQ